MTACIKRSKIRAFSTPSAVFTTPVRLHSTAPGTSLRIRSTVITARASRTTTGRSPTTTARSPRSSWAPTNPMPSRYAPSSSFRRTAARNKTARSMPASAGWTTTQHFTTPAMTRSWATTCMLINRFAAARCATTTTSSSSASPSPTNTSTSGSIYSNLTSTSIR